MRSKSTLGKKMGGFECIKEKMKITLDETQKEPLSHLATIKYHKRNYFKNYCT